MAARDWMQFSNKVLTIYSDSVTQKFMVFWLFVGELYCAT